MVAARRSNPFELILAHLNERNKLWAHNASMLIVNAVEEYDEAGRSLPWAKYDLGQAVAYMSMQATYEGLHLRQMGGVNAAGLHSILELDNRLSVVTISALGVAADPQLLATDRLVRQETAVRRRLPMREILLQSPESCPSIIALDASRLSSGRT